MLFSDIACQERKKTVINIYGEIVFTNTSRCCVFPFLCCQTITWPASLMICVILGIQKGN